MSLATPGALTAEQWQAHLVRRRGGDPARDWATVPEASTLLGYAEETIRTWCRAGYLAHQRAGRKRVYRIPISALAQLLIEDGIAPPQ